MTPDELRKSFDSTNLKLDATEGDIVRLCEEAAAKSFYAVMVYPTSVALCRKVLTGRAVKIGTVIGFPSGRFSTRAKAEEIRAAADHGSDEVDIVIDYAALMAGRRKEVEAELDELVGLARRRGQLSKIIVEICYLDDARAVEALEICETAGADYIKTSTGFGLSGATVRHIQMWRDRRRGPIKLKAAGGIKTLSDARAMLAAGAERLGTSSASAILAELEGGQAVRPSANTY